MTAAASASSPAARSRPERETRALDLVSPCLSHPLFDEERAKREITDVLRPVPGESVPMIGFETGLADRDSVDVFLGFTAGDAAALGRYARTARRGKGGPGEGVLERLATFSERWRRSERLRSDLQHVWLEHDARPGDARERGAPGIFLGRGTALPGDRDALDWARERCTEMARLSGQRPGPEVRDGIETCLARLPAGGGPTSVGYFLDRPHEAVRLCVSGLDPEGAAGWLDEIGHPCDPDAFRTAIGELVARSRGHFGDLGMLHLDVGPRLGDRVGAEFVFEVNEQLSRSRIETVLLDELIGRGLAERDRVEALADWPGAYFAGPPPRSLFLRRVNHLKVVFRDEGLVRAKAYFGVRVRLPRFLGLPHRCAVRGVRG